jgi:hypothetical protein
VKAAAAVAAVCGLILLISLFLSWAQIVCVQAPCVNPSGWEVLRVLDVPIALLAVASVAVAALVVIRQAPAIALALALVGLVSVVLVLLAPLIEARGARPADFGGNWFLSLLAAFGVIAGGLVAFFLLRPSSKNGNEEED